MQKYISGNFIESVFIVTGMINFVSIFLWDCVFEIEYVFFVGTFEFPYHKWHHNSHFAGPFPVIPQFLQGIKLFGITTECPQCVWKAVVVDLKQTVQIFKHFLRCARIQRVSQIAARRSCFRQLKIKESYVDYFSVILKIVEILIDKNLFPHFLKKRI